MKRTLPWLHNYCIHKKKNFKLTLNLWEDKIDLTRGFGESNFYKYMKYKIWFITVAHLTLYRITKWISSFNKHLLNIISASHYVFLVRFEVLKKSTFIIRSLLANLKKIVLRSWSIGYVFFLSISVFTWCPKNKNFVSFLTCPIGNIFCY